MQPLEAGANEIVLTGRDARHLSGPLRARAGDEVTVCNGAGLDFLCRISSINKDTVQLEVLGSAPSAGESSCAITLFQCLPKADKLEQIIQKSIELGAAGIVPVLSSRSVSRPDAAASSKKLQRWNDIALEASKQSGRGAVAPVAPVTGWEDALSRLAALDLPLILYEQDRSAGLPHSIPRAATVGLLIGPEGGLSPQEVEQALAAGISPVWLGPRILRTETAGPAALAVLQYLTGNLGPNQVTTDLNLGSNLAKSPPCLE